MPLMDISKPEIISFLIESYEKTDRLRHKWNQLHSKELQKAAIFKGKEKGYFDTDVTARAMESGLAAITRDHISAGVNRRKARPTDGEVQGVKYLRKTHAIPAVGLGDPKVDPKLARPDDDLSKDPVMRPVKDEQKEIIYKGLPYYGRLEYLKARNEIAPQDKFYFQECTEWGYGWRMQDSLFGRHYPEYGRVQRMTKGIISRTGPQPDPPHYDNMDIFNSSKLRM